MNVRYDALKHPEKDDVSIIPLKNVTDKDSITHVHIDATWVNK